MDKIDCPSCRGAGYRDIITVDDNLNVEDVEFIDCSVCDGIGWVEEVIYKENGDPEDIIGIPCTQCERGTIVRG